MNCVKCGAPLMETDLFCKNCGEKVNKVNNVNNNNNYGNHHNNNQHVNSSNTLKNEVNENNNVINQNDQMNTNNANVNNGPTFNNGPIGSTIYEGNPFNNAQPNNYQMPMYNYNNGYNNQPMYNQGNQNNGLKYALIAVGAIILIVIVVLLVVVFGLLGKDDGNGKNNVGTNAGNNSGGNNSGLVNNTSTYQVNFKNFVFNIPTEMVHKFEGDSLVLGDKEGTWLTYVEIGEATYNQMLAKKSQLPSLYRQQGYTASTVNERTLSGKEFMTMEVSKSSYNMLLGITKANNRYVFITSTANAYNEFDYNILSDISKILGNATYNSSSNSINAFEKIETDILFK